MRNASDYHNVKSCIRMYGIDNIGKNCWSCRTRVATTFVRLHFEERDDIYVYCDLCKPIEYEDNNETFLTKEEFDRKINVILILE